MVSSPQFDYTPYIVYNEFIEHGGIKAILFARI